jgi:hypothetical protein
MAGQAKIRDCPTAGAVTVKPVGALALLRAAALLAAAWCVAGAVRADVPWLHWNEAEILAGLAGQELRGAHAVLRFRADGRWEGRQNGRRVSGRWRVERDELCLLAQGPGAWEECHEVQARGGRVRLLQDGYVVLEGRLKR